MGIFQRDDSLKADWRKFELPASRHPITLENERHRHLINSFHTTNEDESAGALREASPNPAPSSHVTPAQRGGLKNRNGNGFALQRNERRNPQRMRSYNLATCSPRGSERAYLRTSVYQGSSKKGEERNDLEREATRKCNDNKWTSQAEAARGRGWLNEVAASKRRCPMRTTGWGG
ncbi:unnamed protein product [Heligmosomoides polygyrus]|uniref:Uncharacterized protein n=1 Tax=Heligmosomoides polygyrus TaxID=6339 RepID=A0A183G592_HELPZ|nr:unnamed protein product [Heligmosomoides polygyrus]